MSKLHLFNERVAVVEVKEELSGSILLPEHRLLVHQLGRVVATGDGKYRSGKSETIWVKEGDIVLYQLGGPQVNNSLFKLDGKPIRVFHQGDIIARLKKPKVNMENFEIVGNWVLLSAQQEHLVILVPQAAAAPESFIFTVVQKGAGVTVGVEVGDTVYPERGKCAPIELDGKVYVWTLQDFLFGKVKPDGTETDPSRPKLDMSDILVQDAVVTTTGTV